MLTLKILNSDASLNSFQEIGTARFIKGSTLVIIAQLFQSDKKLRFIPDVSAVITCAFIKSDNTTLAKTATFPFADDRSIIRFDITATESLDLISQNLNVKVTVGSSVDFAAADSGLQLVSLTQGC